MVIPIRLLAAAAVTAALSAGCDNQRKQDCERFLAAMSPLDEGMPSVDTVNRVNKEVGALNLHDQPLQIYAENYRKTLTVLASTLAVKESDSPPDGTDDVIKSRLREARTDKDDTARYCAQ